jgi:hypothetical protein
MRGSQLSLRGRIGLVDRLDEPLNRSHANEQERGDAVPFESLASAHLNEQRQCQQLAEVV